MQRLRELIRLVSVIWLLAGLCGMPAAAQGTGDQPTAFEMFAALNQWRLEQNLAPFRYNPTLEALAWLQLEHILALPDIPPNIHDGITGEGPRERALWEPFAWPYYDIPARLDLVEIIVAQKTIAQGIAWWQHSDVHRRAATNPNYREAGVAALPYVNGTVFVAVLGGRPDVLPALIHPDRQTLYLTRENFWGATTGNGYLVHVTEVRLLDTDRTPLTDWQPWQPTLPLPDVSGGRLYVEYSDGEQTVTTEVDMQRDVILLPESVETLRPLSAMSARAMNPIPEAPAPAGNVLGAEVALVVNGPDSLVFQVTTEGPIYLEDFQIFGLIRDAPTVVLPFSEAFDGMRYAAPGSCFIYTAAGNDLAMPEACTGLTVVKQVAPEDVFWYDSGRGQPTPFFVLGRSGGLLADCREAGAACTFHVNATPAPSGAGGEEPVRISRELRLVYNATSLTVINNGGQPLNLYGLAFRQDTVTLRSEMWNRTALTADLGYFPADDCLQVVVYGTGQPRKPPDCGVRHGWIAVQTNQAIWTTGTFEVLFNGTSVTTCEASKGECIFELP